MLDVVSCLTVSRKKRESTDVYIDLDSGKLGGLIKRA